MSPSCVQNYFYFLLVVRVICALVGSVNCLQCFVCDYETKNPSCDNFDPSNKNLYAKDCPPNLRSCGTERHGKIIKRFCDDSAIMDCKTANNIKYCYCTFDHCNGDEPIKESINHKLTPTDDEDFIESSGHQSTFTKSHINQQTVTTVAPANTGNSLRSIFILTMAAMSLH